MSAPQQATIAVSIGAWLLSQPVDGTTVPGSAAPYFDVTNSPGGLYSVGGPSGDVVPVGPGGPGASVGPDWPSGLTINTATGAISGTSAAGTYAGLYLTYTLPNGVVVRTATFTLVISTPRLYGTLSGNLAYSNDSGTSWVDTGGAISNLQMVKTTGKWFAVAPGSSTQRMLTSTDGESFSIPTFPWVGRFGAVGTNGTRVVLGGTDSPVTSVFAYYTDNDGGSWSPCSFDVAPTSGNLISRIRYIDGLWVMAVSTADYVYTSADGISWTKRTVSTTYGTANLILAGKVAGRWLFLEAGNINAHYTTDFSSWSSFGIPSGLFSDGITDTVGATNGSRLVVSGMGLYYTDTGTSLTLCSGTTTAYRTKGVTWNGTNFLASRFKTGPISVDLLDSSDGLTFGASASSSIITALQQPY